MSNINFRAESCRRCGEIMNGNDRSSHKCIADKLFRAVNSLKTIMGYIENGTLVRDISHDHEPMWALKMMDFVRDLKEAQETVRELSRSISQKDGENA